MEEGRSKLKCKSVKERKICGEETGGEGVDTVSMSKGILLHRRRKNVCSETARREFNLPS